MTNIYTLLLSAFCICKTSFSKTDSISSSQYLTISSHVFDSGWESDLNWNETIVDQAKVLYLKRSMPNLTKEVLEKGVVLVFAKGYQFIAPGIKEKPIQIPSLLFSADENNVSYNLLLSKVPGSIEVGLKIPDQGYNDFVKHQKTLQLRYFVIDVQLLQKLNLKKQELQNMSYQQLASLLNINP